MSRALANDRGIGGVPQSQSSVHEHGAGSLQNGFNESNWGPPTEKFVKKHARGIPLVETNFWAPQNGFLQLLVVSTCERKLLPELCLRLFPEVHWCRTNLIIAGPPGHLPNNFRAKLTKNIRKNEFCRYLVSLTTVNHHVEWIKGLFVKSRKFAFFRFCQARVGKVCKLSWGRNESLLLRRNRSMLVLSRKKNESIVINDDITIVVVEIRGDKVRLGVEAPKEVPVHRNEVYEAIRRNQQAANEQPTEQDTSSAAE